MPDTTTRPWQWRMRSTAATKSAPSRAASPTIALASVASTSRASESTCAGSTATGGRGRSGRSGGGGDAHPTKYNRARPCYIRSSSSRAARNGHRRARPMPQTLQLILVLLGAAVVVVVVCRLVRLPPILGYLLVGMVVGPHALAWVPDNADVRDLAEFGIVFLMFSIGLEFSLPQLKAMRRAVFGLGLAQVAITTIGAMLALHLVGYGWQAGFALGGALAMSSTAIVSKMLAERMELATPHGRDVMAHPAVPGPRGRRLPDHPAVARQGRRRPRGRSRAGGPQGGGRAGADPVRRTKADAGVVPPGRAAAQLRALHAEPAADHARARGADGARGTVARAGRVPRRHADRRDRVPLPGRGGHQAVPRRAARPLLRHRRDGARSRGRRPEHPLGAAAARRARRARSSC